MNVFGKITAWLLTALGAFWVIDSMIYMRATQGSLEPAHYMGALLLFALTMAVVWLLVWGLTFLARKAFFQKVQQ
jgi:uncharacterized membrane protein